MRKQMAIVGERGVNPTTHCYITGRPLEKAPHNYSLGNGLYVSVNVGRSLSALQLAQIKDEFSFIINPEPIEEIEIEEVEEYDN